ncbi:NAD+ synthase [Granulicella sp. 5B5]|uniref:NAD+ synthase n=1 Tax=Granulicella sp. 5B5 TaxID=1617967 RepID=UPI0015F543E7|nr:NAD+ synthase [Granulicella sp. 5B5]QMV20041.1 NAD+ synthase [Granulicella sp. 5B5]
MRIALAQINPTVGDFAGNLALISGYVERAAAQAAELVIFPELATCGYPPADLLEKESFVAQAEATLVAVAELTRGEGRPAILCGSPMRCENVRGKHVRNVAALLADGAVHAVQQKMLLPFYDVFDEQRYFEPGHEQSLSVVKGHAVAVTVCEDAWNDKMFWPRQLYPVDPVEELMRQWAVLPQPLSGHRLILNISASPYWHDKIAVRQKMLGALAKRHRATIVMVNQVGANDSLVFDGSSLVVGPDGEVLAQAKSFAEDLLIVDTTAPDKLLVPPSQDEVALTWQALVLGTRDYLRKCGFKKAIVGLSGGIDSALVAAIAVEALGAENVQGVGMPSEFSSSGSVSDAEKLAANLGIAFSIVPIREIYTRFTGALEPFFEGTAFGLAEENLQPRIRGSLLMALSNKTGALVLTTGNKSEMACGYCTLYGDMVGALAVIADVYKTEVYALSRYVNREREIIPEDTLTKPPSAELRPGQKDTDSLPPYDVLDPILRAYVEEYASAEEIVEAQGVDLALVRRVIRLVEISEYKRQQAAPVLKVSRKSFGMGRRFPIAARR